MFGKRFVEEIIEVEGGYIDHPSDRGGPTCWGITEAVARRNGYTGSMRHLPRELAAQIYFQRYITGPGFHRVAELAPRIAEELADSGVNLGQSIPSTWLQRWLNSFNRQGRDYPDIATDGVIGPATLVALKAFMAKRGEEGERVLYAALNCSQGHRYLELSEGRQENEDFIFGWLRARVLADQ